MDAKRHTPPGKGRDEGLREKHHVSCFLKDEEDSSREDVKVQDIPGRAQNMSQAERHESPGYFWRTVIRLEGLKDRVKEGLRRSRKAGLEQDEGTQMPG